MSIRTLADLMAAEDTGGDFPLIPEGEYNAVITEAEVRPGKKGPYIKLTAVIHDEEYKGRKAWKNAVSFSERALGMPGGPKRLAKATNVMENFDQDTPFEELPALMANGIISTPVVIVLKHEQAGNSDGSLKFNDDGSPKMREVIHDFEAAPQEFIDAFELEAAGVDDDLPF